MAVILKRSNGTIRNECVYRCCTDLLGKNVKKVRRSVKRREKQAWKKAV